MMDFSSLDLAAAAGEAREMPVRHPGTGETTGAVLHVLGFDAPGVVAAGREFDRRMASLPRNERPDLVGSMQKRQLALAKAAVVGWSGFVWDGAEKQFDEAFAHDLLSKPGFSWLVEQVNVFGGDRANLFQTPPKA